MKTYVIIRRAGWQNSVELGEAADRSVKKGDDSKVLWIRSYVLDEGSQGLGTVCIYQAVNPQALRDHAKAAVLPCDEIIEVADTVIVRPDPEAEE